MKALVFVEPGKMEIREVSRPVCERGGLLVKVETCGFCGSDLRTYRYGHSRVTPPWIIGHEIAGVVAELGEGVVGFLPGERVAVAPPVYCGTCYYCRQSVFYLCQNQREIAQSWLGGFAEYIAIPPEAITRGNIHHLPGEVSFEEATLSEPASSCINAHEGAGTTLGETVVVIGAGPVGCLHLEVARARGASRVIMVDVQESRLRRAERFHPDLLIKSDENGSHVDRVVDFTGGWGAQVVIVACPSAKAQQEAIHMACKGGRVLLFGGLPPDVSEVPLSTNLIHYRGIHVMGAFSFSPRHHVLSIRMIAEKKIHAREYITHLLPLERFQEGIDALLRGDALKVVLKPGDFTIQV